MKKIVIDPITRLEGHGKIHIFLDDNGNCVKAVLQVPELRGFEKFAEGRHAEDMPIITSRICGVCPTAHHMASTKTLDDLFKVDPPVPAKKIRELFYNLFMLEDHALHVYVLGGPDLFIGYDAPKEERNLVGLLKKFGKEVFLKVISTRKKIRDMMERIGGRAIHPVLGVPGGVSRPLNEDLVRDLKALAEEGIEFALFTYKLFKDVVLKNPKIVDMLKNPEYERRTYYMGLVDDKNRVNFYDGKLRVVDPDGKEFAKFDVHEYREHIAEHVEEWTYITFPYLRKVGWKGFVDGKDSGIFSVAPLARLNVSDSMPTPKAQEAFEEMYEFFGARPAHNLLANHYARIVEMIYAAERIKELAEDPDILEKDVRVIPENPPEEGIGVVEAPRGTLIHHYITDERGVIKKVNLLVATQHNIGRINMDIDHVARAVIKNGNINDAVLNMVEMAFRAYDPCFACGTHSLDGKIVLEFKIYRNRKLIDKRIVEI